MLKKILAAVTALALMISAGYFASSVPFGTAMLTIAAEEYTCGIFSYKKVIDYYTRLEYIEITGCDESVEGEIVIPAEIDGMPVTTIGSAAFRDCTGLTSIVISYGITTIDSIAFWGCTNLTSITIPDSVTAIRVGAFSGCSSLASITIPDSVTVIGSQAFYNCTALTSITLPDSVKIISLATFGNCTGLSSIEIPDSVIYIGEDCFVNCTALTSITLPDSVKTIHNGAFENCSALKSVTIPDSITTIADETFKNCTSLTSVTIPDSVKTIKSSAFLNCSALTSIDIPDSVTAIENNVVMGCTSLTSITIPDSVTKLGNNTFRNCSSLTSVTLSDNIAILGDYSFNGCSELISVTIPESLTKIGNGMFKDCTSLKSISLPEGITSIGKEAFYGSGLSSIEFPEDCEYLTIGNNAFEKSAIEKLTINCKSDIGEDAFANCDSLLTAELHDAHVSKSAFSDCSSLREIIFSGTTVLDQHSITDCPVLENIDFTDCELTSDYSVTKCPMLVNLDSFPAFDSDTGDFTAEKKEFIYEHFNGADDVGFMNQFVNAQVDKIVSEYITEDMSDLQRVIAMHDWVCENTKYTEGNTKDHENHNDASVFINEYTVCEGYARACNLLYNAAGIETYYVQSPNHAWNIVNIEGHYFHVDATWDDGDTISRNWFLKSDEEFKIAGGSHAEWELYVPSSLHSFQKKTLPECKNKMGDVNFDGIVDAADASDVLQAYADLSTNQASDIDRILADYNLDGIIDSSDASDILAVYAYNSTN